MGVIGEYIGMVRIHRTPALWMLLSGLSAVLALHEFYWLRLPIPQLHRQTSKWWRTRFGAVGAAWLWGLDLGSGLTTIVTFSGYWILVLAALSSGEAWYGGLILGMFGVSRAIVVFLMPKLVMLQENHLCWMIQTLPSYQATLHKWHALGLFIIGMGLAVRLIKLHLMSLPPNVSGGGACRHEGWLKGLHTSSAAARSCSKPRGQPLHL